MKSLKEISWQVTEDTYRKDPAFSYSTLARFAREGFEGIPHLYDSIETPSLTFGSAVDALITGGQKEFDERFLVADYPSTPDSIVKLVKELFALLGDKYTYLYDIPDSTIINLTEARKYQLNWKPETRARVIKEQGKQYYSLLFLAKNKTILDNHTKMQVDDTVKALKESEATKWYFAENNPFDDIERYYQLKFKATFEGIPYRCMSDLLVVNTKDKTIIPVDLKTSSHPEWEFYKSFIQWSYSIQARLYWRIIKANLEEDDYFKDFTLQNYKFIVVNKATLTPLVWEFPDTAKYGPLVYGSNKQTILPEPFDLGQDLKYYLQKAPNVPIGINENEPNDITNWLNKEKNWLGIE